MNQKILLIEDERKLAGSIQSMLYEEGFDTAIASNGQEGKDLFYSTEYDLIIVDINLPFINGYDLVKLIRSKNEIIPIIIITAFDQTNHKLKGFELGTDDYIVKPFELKELLARINSLLRRIDLIHDQKSSKTNIIKVANLEINFDSKRVKRDDVEIVLTAKEFSLLEYLIKNKNKVVSREEIAKNVWQIDFDPQTNVIDVYVNYLRKKVDKDFSPRLIYTKVGMGYVLKAPED